MTIDRQLFWERKILEWEVDRYAGGSAKTGLLERLASKASDSLRFRISITPELLAPHVKGKRILDIGCGSGLIAAPLIEFGAKFYTGIDIAPTAVANAKEYSVQNGVADRTAFHVASVDDLSAYDADIVVSLGLLDWLTDRELDLVFQASQNGEFFHAIAERRKGPIQLIHRTYCWLSYGRKNGGYVPRYYSIGGVEALAMPHHAGPLNVWRDRRLSFGAFVSSLDLAQQTDK